MNITEKAAYLKGMAEGMELDESSKEGKLLKLIIDLLGDITHEIEDLNENAMDLAEEIDELSDDLADVEETLADCCDDCCCDDDDDDCCCCDDDEDDEDPVFYEITCPNCGETFSVDEDVLSYDSMPCPKCGEKLEFEFDEDDEDDDCCCKKDDDCRFQRAASGFRKQPFFAPENQIFPVDNRKQSCYAHSRLRL